MLTLRAALVPLALPAVLGSLASLAGCGASRTIAATQPGSPAAFESAGSDAKAVAIADEVLAAAGGAATWAKVKELRWTTAIVDGGETKLKVEHAWDRWNGRAYMKNLPQVADASPTLAMYELYGDTKAAIVNRPAAARSSRTPATPRRSSRPRASGGSRITSGSRCTSSSRTRACA